MVGFTGSMKLRVVEANGLKPPATTSLAYWGMKSTAIDPYVLLNVDDVPIAQTTSKPRTFDPVWNEDFESEVENGQVLGITVWHNSLMPPDPFVANSTVSLEEIINSGSSDIWVGCLRISLEFKCHWCRLNTGIFAADSLGTRRQGPCFHRTPSHRWVIVIWLDFH